MNDLAIGFLIVCAIVMGLVAVYDAAKQREGVQLITAYFLTILCTPVVGLLYCLCFPLKKEK